PSAGSGSIFGLDIERDSADIRSRVGYLPQDPKFYEHMTARETLRFGAGFFFSGPKTRIEDRVSEMLELVGLRDKGDRPVKTFSGGEVQRLGIAQAQIHAPELLILDEPAAALDPLGRRDVLSILEQFRATSTVFYSTHILDDVQRVSDTVCILNHGEIATQGPIGTILDRETEVSYSVEVQGDVERARAALLAQPWIDGVTVNGSGDSAALTIAVSDTDAADAQIQRVLLADDSLVVREFRRNRASLEDVFVDLVQEERGDV
ncbi:MAG: ABC transporter ATP-binding protein, partial [Acidimicrobiia bacterium]